jgi:hypothetical protein
MAKLAQEANCVKAARVWRTDDATAVERISLLANLFLISVTAADYAQ